MAIRTNLKSLAPRRQQYKREITLLSHGFNNAAAWPDGKITVYPWDNTIDNWLLENIRKLSRTELVYGLLSLCADLNGGNIDSFVADEINVVLLVSRAAATDGIVTYTATCPFCSSRQNARIEVPNQLEKVGEKSAQYVGYDEITLPVVKDSVQVRPLLVRDEKLISGREEERRKAIPDAELRTLMRVVAINGTKPDTLDELVNWARALHARDIKFLDDQGRDLTPHLNTNIAHICDEADCGKKFTFPLSFDLEFFR